ncbi:ATP-binding protein [Bacteroides sp. An269]|uniref:ATP-binding protein n=1 Tax=Bacteroides sp. An269 TaxID=1965613 RepID=UPI000B3AB83E|nr:ATP-binding protein [Bacteroides sp. An269]OUO64840.1 AAA family ATPase [Bacteroides sp. An269]
MKYPIGIQSFAQIREDHYTYVDKTALIYQLVSTGKIYFLSRPRRFGKSLLVSTLKNYFSGRKELFKGLAIEKLETEWREYPVFHIDFNGSNFTVPGTLEKKLEGYIAGWEAQYGKSTYLTDVGDRFAYVLKQAHEQSGRRCVVLIDEYDKPILDVLDTGIKGEQEEMLLEERNREVLKGFYSVFKAADDDLQFVLLTGVTKFSQVSVFSGFNQPADISMDRRYEALCGITQEELEHYFAGPISDMADREGISKEEMTGLLKRQYDGYHFSKAMTDIYNPFSLLNAFATRDMQDYWFRSGTPSYLIRLLAHTDENLDELTGKYYDPQEFVDYKANVEKPLPMIYQSGYLTIKGYDRDFGTFLLDFPNNEVKKGFVALIASDYLKPRQEMGSWVRNVVLSLRRGELEKLNKLFTSFLADIPYTMRRKQDERERERYFHYTFYLIFSLVSVYTVYTEKEQSEGRVDCIVETPDYVYIFEFKLDGSADEALKQIEEKGYARPYASDRRLIYKIGSSFSSQTGTIDDWKIQG